MIAFLYPGQGSQTKGMAKFLYDEHKEAKECLEEASESLKLDMKTLLFEDPENQLNLTEFTQPALVCAATMYQRVFQKLSATKVDYLAGHSLGEYSAFVASGVVSFRDALSLTRARGRFMQEAVPLGAGAMLAVLGGSDDKVGSACEQIEEPIQVANFNSPGQVVVSGTKAAIEAFQQIDSKTLYGEKWKMIPLKVSAPFHSSLMQPAEDKMRPLIAETSFSTPTIAIVQNYTAKETLELNDLKENLIRQITAPVRWTASITRMRELGVKYVVEMGPGKVLSGLVKKIDSEGIQAFNINDLNSLDEVIRKLEA